MIVKSFNVDFEMDNLKEFVKPFKPKDIKIAFSPNGKTIYIFVDETAILIS